MVRLRRSSMAGRCGRQQIHVRLYKRKYANGMYVVMDVPEANKEAWKKSSGQPLQSIEGGLGWLTMIDFLCGASKILALAIGPCQLVCACTQTAAGSKYLST